MTDSYEHLPVQVLQAAAMVKLLLLDVDGVLTDGRIYYSESGHEMKAFNIQDGLGIKLLQQNGIEVGIITGRSSQLLQRRAAELGITRVTQGREDKLTALKEVVAELKAAGETFEPHEIAYMGDDLPDLSAIRYVGLGTTVANGSHSLVQHAKWQASRRGGEGAVRELAELILHAQGKLEQSSKPFF